MSEPALRRAAERVRHAISRAASEYSPQVLVRSEGRVVSATDGVLHIHGLRGARTEELLALGGGDALVLGLSRDAVEAVALGDADRVKVGDSARAMGHTLTVAVGDALLGRVVDPLGRPLDAAPLGGTLKRMPLEAPAPQIHERAAVHEPLYTGTLAIDALFPIGRGQRELLLGDEGTGKTSIAVDAMLRQRASDVVSVYVAVGRRRDEVSRIVDTLRHGGGRWVVVAAFADASPGLRYLAPYAGTAVAEHFMHRGEHALVVHDDLSAHATAWRELSLLLRRPPGREAYPGDVFYLHSRLLERGAQLSVDLGGGSLTVLPLATLEGGRLTTYIPTNLVSITDGQIVLSQEAFASGQRPAIDAALSVSRVGAAAQPQAFRALAGRLRLDYAAFLEVEAFSRLSGHLEAATVRRIELGKRIRRLLRGRPQKPLTLAEETLRLALASEADLVLRIPEAAIEEAALVLSDRFRDSLPEICSTLNRDAVLNDGDRKRLVALMERVVGAKYPGTHP